MKKIILALLVLCCLSSCVTYRVQVKGIWYSDSGVPLDTFFYSYDMHRKLYKNGYYPLPRQEDKKFSKHIGTAKTGEHYEGGLFKYIYFIDTTMQPTCDR